jgi:hypothetical protein
MVFLGTEFAARHTAWIRADGYGHALSLLSHFKGLANLR